MHKTARTSSMSLRLTGRGLSAALTAALILCLTVPRATQAYTGGDPATGINWTVTADGTLEVSSEKGTAVVITCVDGRVRVNGIAVHLPDELGGGPLFAADVIALYVYNTSSEQGDIATTFDLSGVTADCFTALSPANIYARVDHEIEEGDTLIDSPISDPLGFTPCCSAVPFSGLVTLAWLMACRVRRTRP